MYTKQFTHKEFTNPQELTAYFATNKEAQVVTVVEFQGKWLAFYYEKVWWYQGKAEDSGTDFFS